MRIWNWLRFFVHDIRDDRSITIGPIFVQTVRRRRQNERNAFELGRDCERGWAERTTAAVSES